jgi:hypothetical protein
MWSTQAGNHNMRVMEYIAWGGLLLIMHATLGHVPVTEITNLGTSFPMLAGAQFMGKI